jgi:hypothetical protein
MVLKHKMRKHSDHLEMHMLVSVKLPLNASMLDQENAIQSAINHAGLESTRLLLTQLDTKGQPLVVRDKAGRQMTLTAKSQRIIKQIETPYGAVDVPRYVYQSSLGGACMVPLDQAAGLIGSATPKFAQMVSSKVAEMPPRRVIEDLSSNHQRKVSLDQVQGIADRVGELAREHEPHLSLQEAGLPAKKEVATITIGVVGASMLMSRCAGEFSSDRRKKRELNWRMAMVGTISFYDREGQRLQTIYQAKSPPEEGGKEAFWKQLEMQVDKIKAMYPKARYTGVSDGAPDLVNWLKMHTTVQVLDYYHAAAYLDAAAPAFYGKPEEAAAWAAVARRDLLEGEGVAKFLLNEMKERRDGAGERLSQEAREGLEKAIGYIEPRLERMNYAKYRGEGIPIGSGVTESACKLIIKQRMCGPGMRWGHRASDHVLALRCLVNTDGMWRVLWKKLSPSNNDL